MTTGNWPASAFLATSAGLSSSGPFVTTARRTSDGNSPCEPTIAFQMPSQLLQPDERKAMRVR